MTIEEARRQFPHTWTDMIYLNHAAISPMMFCVREAVASYLERRALKDIESFPWSMKLALRAKQKLATLLGTTASRLAFVLNTSEGLSILADGLSWKEGDRILLYRREFPTNVYPFLNQRRKGVAIDFFEPDDSRITVDAIKAHITPQTKLLSLSAVQFLAGYRADLSAIGAFCKEHGILFCVDAIQAMPHIPIDIVKSNIDFLSCGGHKWLMAPEGIAFVYVSERAQSLIHQSSMGWTTVKDVFNTFDYDVGRIRDDASRYENGTMNYPGIAGLLASLEFFESFGYEEMYQRVLAHSGMIVEACALHGVQTRTPMNAYERAGIVAIDIEEPESVFKRLEGRGIVAAVRAGKLRVSPHFYNTEEEIKKAIGVIFE